MRLSKLAIISAVILIPSVAAAQEDEVLAEAKRADVVVKANGVGVFDRELLEGILEQARPDAVTVFWDVDAAYRSLLQCDTPTWLLCPILF